MKEFYEALMLEIRDGSKTTWGRNELIAFVKNCYIEQLERIADAKTK